MKCGHRVIFSRQKIQSHLFGSLQLLFGDFRSKQLLGVNVSNQIDLTLASFSNLMNEFVILVKH